MHCVNHPDTDVQSFCQNCGKPLCSACVRKTAAGQILCEPCTTATGGAPTDPGQAYWQGAANIPPGQIPPFFVPLHGPNPSAAAVLGLIPGVGAMYNGQFFKALIHVVIFVVLVSITQRYGVFGIFIGAWVLYQSFEAFHTAKARRDGQPVPDPFGLNELGSWLNLGLSGRGQQPPNPNPPPPPAGGYAQTEPPPYTAPYTSSWSGYGSGFGANAAPGAAGPIPPQPPYTEPFAGPNPEPYPYPEAYPPGANDSLQLAAQGTDLRLCADRLRRHLSVAESRCCQPSAALHLALDADRHGCVADCASHWLYPRRP